MNYSFLMSIYRKDNPKWLADSIESMLNQTIMPNQIVIVQDGPLTQELEEVINLYLEQFNIFTIKKLPQNMGLGVALSVGIMLCNNEYIARMDADDIARTDRCEKQLKIISEGKYDVVGSLVDEFTDSIENVRARVILPEMPGEVEKFAHKRCPIRHSSLMYRKSKVLEAGNYREFHLYEDYDLITRMIMSGARCYNIQEVLTYMRVSDDFYARRGGLKYFKSIKKLRQELYRKGFTNRNEYVYATTANFLVCIMPNKVREWVYIHLLRDRGKKQ